MPPEPTDPARDVLWRDLRPVLDAALDRLPERYRLPLVLCYLEGRTQRRQPDCSALRWARWPRTSCAAGASPLAPGPAWGDPFGRRSDRGPGARLGVG